MDDREIIDHRTVARFAWLPTRLDSGEWVHLCWYEADEILEPDYAGVSTGNWIVVARHTPRADRAGHTP